MADGATRPVMVAYDQTEKRAILLRAPHAGELATVIARTDAGLSEEEALAQVRDQVGQFNSLMDRVQLGDRNRLVRQFPPPPHVETLEEAHRWCDLPQEGA